MKSFLITTDPAAKQGLRLSGVDGVLVNDKESIKSVLESVLSDSEIALVMITGGIKELYPEIEEVFNLREKPVLCEIPDSGIVEEL